jgi:Flp pilus assembly secretin CpaC
VTYGDNITVVPTVRDNGEVLMQLFSTRSSLIELNSVSAGEGATFQQINTPVLNRKKFSQNFRVRDGETLIIVSNVSNSLGSKDRQGITGASTTANRSKVMSVLMVTPRVQGI